MKSDLIETLAAFLEDGIEGDDSEVAVRLAEADLVDQRVTAPSRCLAPNCGAHVEKSWESDEDGVAYELICKNGCETAVSTTEATSYRLQTPPTFAAISSHFGLSPGQGDGIDEHLPQYAEAATAEGVYVCLILDPHRYADTVRDILFDAVNRQRPTILLTPRESSDEIIEIAESYPLGSLVTPLPLELLTKREVVTEIVETSRSTRDMEAMVFEKRGISGDELAEKLSGHPRLIEAQLNYIRILREDSTRRYDLGEQMETVCKAAFMTLDCRLRPEFGGTEDRGESIPDIVFQLPHHTDEEHPSDRPPVLGIVDAKSGSDANFEDEDIVGKHEDYIQYAKYRPLFNSYDLTHLFVVFDIDGYNEIGWFDGIKPTYRKHTGMVVLHADALVMLVRIAQSGLLRNEVNMGGGGLNEFVRPFFQRRLYTDVDAYPHLATVTRFDGVEELTARQEEYIDEYRRRPGLLVVTGEMVRRRFEDAVGEDGVEAVLEQYVR